MKLGFAFRVEFQDLHSSSGHGPHGPHGPLVHFHLAFLALKKWIWAMFNSSYTWALFSSLNSPILRSINRWKVMEKKDTTQQRGD